MLLSVRYKPTFPNYRQGATEEVPGALVAFMLGAEEASLARLRSGEA